MASDYIKSLLTPLVMQKMQIKTIIRYHYMRFRKAKMIKADNTRGWRGCTAAVTHTYCNLK